MMVEFFGQLPVATQAWLSNLGENIEWRQLFLIGMTPLFLLVFLIEVQVLKRQGKGQSVHPKEVLANLGLGGSYLLMEGLMFVLLTGLVFDWAYEQRLWTVPVNTATAVFIFLAVEFCFYWFHRASHRVRWFWTAHVPHHSGEVMNFTTAMRQSVLNAFVCSWVFYLPLAFLGVPPAVIFFCLSVSLAYQYFIHTESIGKLPRWFEAIFNTPSHHRAHHGRDAHYIDRNFGGVFIVFDRMFGTFVEEGSRPNFGIPQQIRSYNFVVLNFHELFDLLRDVAAPGPWKERVKHLIMPPEWERPGHTPIRTWPVEEKRS